MKWISTASLLLALGLGCTAGQALAQDGSTAQSFDALSARVEQRDREIRQLQAQVAGMQQSGVNAAPVSYAPSEGTAATTAAPATPQCAEVGSDLSAKVHFLNGAGLMFETPNKDFTMHLGGLMQWDTVAWKNSGSPAALAAPGNTTINAPPAAARSGAADVQGVAAGGIGFLSDGEYFRRLRIIMDGTFWENFEYRWVYAFDNNQFSTLGLGDFYIGVNNLPVIGTIRVGQMRPAMGLEGDLGSSSAAMTFMERSAYSESIELSENYVGGIYFGDTYANERGTWSAEAFRPDTNNNGNSGDFFGTGQWGLQARITGLPLYEDEGRNLLHLGLSGGWRNGNNAGNNAANAAGGATTVDLRARPELRDDDPASSASATLNQTTTTAASGQPLPDANSNRLVDTGKLSVVSEYLLGTELLSIHGPLSLQAEYGWNFLYGAPTVGAATGVNQYYAFNGGYFQAAYTLTGENRHYDKRNGCLNRTYFGNLGPYENAFLVRDEDGAICTGHGAWEIAARYSYVDLNSGSGKGFVNGGIMTGTSLALNWYLNSNVTIMTDWVLDNRYDCPGNNGKPAGSGATFQGTTNGVGTEVQLSY